MTKISVTKKDNNIVIIDYKTYKQNKYSIKIINTLIKHGKNIVIII